MKMRQNDDGRTSTDDPHPAPCLPRRVLRVRLGGMVMGKRTAAAQARRNRQRGAESERELAAMLSDALGFVVQRRLGQERDSGGDLHVGGFSVECKRRKRIAQIYDWFAQARKAADKVGKIPVVMFRSDGHPWLVAFSLGDAVNLMRESLPSRTMGWCGNCKAEVNIPHECPVMAVPWNR